MSEQRKDPERIRTGREGGLTGWANTDERGQRHQRMEAVRNNSPASDGYWYAKLGLTPGPACSPTLRPRLSRPLSAPTTHVYVRRPPPP